MTQTVSVVIPTYNYGRFIAGAIKGALDQTHPPVEVVVVDDGSSDDTETIVREFVPRVKYIKQENAGVCAARNRGAAESTGEFIAFLDADDTWEKAKLEKQLGKFSASEKIGLVHCGIREFDGQTGKTLHIDLDGGEEGVAENLLLWEGPLIVGPGGTIMVTRVAFEAIGGFDERMKVGEDWDFCYRIARRFNVGFVPEPLVNYRSHGAAAHRNVENMERGMLMFYEKAFADPSVAGLRSHAYSNFHKVMAGSYFHAGNYRKFASHAFKSIWLRPANLRYFLEFPLRRISAHANPPAIAPHSHDA